MVDRQSDSGLNLGQLRLRLLFVAGLVSSGLYTSASCHLHASHSSILQVLITWLVRAVGRLQLRDVRGAGRRG